jgi:hypothetical protein
MSLVEDLPAPVVELLRSGIMCEFATINSAGVPIDTPMLYLPAEDLSSFDVATGLAYPVKAERARRNPRAGILVEGRPGEPVIAIAGLAAVRDADLQAAADRYLAEAGYVLVGGVTWELARQAVWYWTRIIVEIAPLRICWWDEHAAMDRPPHVWNAPAGTIYPASDPRPPGRLSEGPNWKLRDWRELAGQALARNAPAHLSLLDDEGFPVPVPVRPLGLGDDTIELDVPIGAPWRRRGKATLTFEGLETFVGEVSADGGVTSLIVERPMPVHPQMEDPMTQWLPTPENREILMRRLEHETRRRGQPIPVIPEQPPQPSESAKLRMARVREAAETQFAESLDGSPLSNLAELVGDGEKQSATARKDQGRGI